ncbi:hypothetical protein A2801_00970 [Candidatus Woesebacteria bacterium RIFCSPHIGHO2_01_FULL_41_10]|uniref:Uncharacterized protein n=1 Tax=Candidatus Woesebacteria bacterium RIFCSPHIGHO2_01_FULL_41_10 TaxID=1802500 RepID=A0A1F7YRP1_9BACT|nr:MAG: hypothetical protein A2801_00970 [Candidatus Woesebacteria bacterium RIFCSPHIGHO2_01_FULL_41_10]
MSHKKTIVHLFFLSLFLLLLCSVGLVIWHEAICPLWIGDELTYVSVILTGESMFCQYRDGDGEQISIAKGDAHALRDQGKRDYVASFSKE